VTVHSAGPGQGSEFVVRLPALPPPPAEAVRAQGEADRPKGVSRHILIIEDNADTRATLDTLLRLVGHRVDVAATGPEGIERALSGRPQVALVDLGLPVVDGYEVARQLRAAVGADMRIIALTGHASDEDRRRTREAGFDAHLVKPVELEELNQLLAGMVRPPAGSEPAGEARSSRAERASPAGGTPPEGGASPPAP
jgi:CheY-like chemotaxis protein